VIVRETEGGQSWSELAELDPLASVLDPADQRGRKNHLIDRVHKRALNDALGDVSGKTILDFGCGTGRLSDWLVKRGGRVEGVDVTPEMVAVAEARVPGANFQTIGGPTLPFADGSFDFVVTAYVLQYYVKGDLRVAQELARVLRDDGKLVAIEQVADEDVGRGGTVAAYDGMLSRAGFRLHDVSKIRMADSRVMALAQQLPLLSRMPIVPVLLAAEARRQERAPLERGRYADALFCAKKVSD
jgi:SAM-dependent methyltransferase